MIVSEIKVLLADCPDDAVCYLYNGNTAVQISKIVLSSDIVPKVITDETENEPITEVAAINTTENSNNNQTVNSQRINNKIIFK